MRLSLAQIHLVRESYQAVGDIDQLTQDFYEALFRSDRRFAELFDKTRMTQHLPMFTRTLKLLVDHIDEKTFLPPYLRGLGHMHSAFGVDASHFGAFGDSLIAALAGVLGTSFTTEHRAAWRATLAYFFRLMREGSSTAFDETVDA